MAEITNKQHTTKLFFPADRKVQITVYIFTAVLTSLSLLFIFIFPGKEAFLYKIILTVLWILNASLYLWIFLKSQQVPDQMQSERNFTNAILENAGALLVVLDRSGKICKFNRAAEKISGYSFEEIEGRYPWDTFLPSEDADRIKQNAFQSFAEIPDSMVGHYTNEWISKNGSRHLIEWVNTLLLDESGQMEFMVALGNDITKRNEAEKYIQEQARLLDIIFQYSLDSLVILDKDYNFIRVTETYAKACQRDSSSFPGLNHFELYPSDFEQEHAEYKKNKIIYSKNARPFIFPDHPEWGTTYWDLAMVPILDATGEIEMFVFTLKNVTEEKNNALNLEKSLQEKEILLKEVHHRVKNNLQIISSLLFLQSQKITDPDHLELFRESQNRVSTMALIHEQLYQTNNFAEVNFDRYTKNLIESLFQTYGIDKSLISHSIQTSNILLDINLAITCGLVLNEIVSNSLKYAFAERKSGKIQIHLTKDNRILHLQVSDNGIGFPEGFQKENSTSLGLKLIDRMVNQLQGKLNQNSSKEGVEYSIQFPESGYESIVNTSQNAGFIGR